MDDLLFGDIRLDVLGVLFAAGMRTRVGSDTCRGVGGGVGGLRTHGSTNKKMKSLISQNCYVFILLSSYFNLFFVLCGVSRIACFCPRALFVVSKDKS